LKNIEDNRKEQRFEVAVNDRKIVYSVSASTNTDLNVKWRDFTWIFRASIKETPLKFGSLISGGSGPCIDQVSVRVIADQ